jgi:hypothetical protein
MRLAAISWRRRTKRVGGIVRMWSSSSTLNSSVESYSVIEGWPLPVETLYDVSDYLHGDWQLTHVCATMLHTAHVRRRSWMSSCCSRTLLREKSWGCVG